MPDLIAFVVSVGYGRDCTEVARSVVFTVVIDMVDNPAIALS